MEANAHSFVAIVNLLAAACSESAGGWVHWGATTQDIFDTANMLRHKAAFEFALRLPAQDQGRAGEARAKKKRTR